jgi:hypothetical protein
MNENLDRNDRTSRADAPNANPGAPEGGNRKRRFLLGSLVSGSAILALASRPALATSCSYSGSQSNNPSGTKETCGGCSKGFYHNTNTGFYTGTNISPSQDFFASGFFHFLTRSSNPPSPPGVWTFFDALNNNFTVTQIGSHDFPGQCAAAYINAERFSGVGGLPSFGYTTSQIVAFIQQG